MKVMYLGFTHLFLLFIGFGHLTAQKIYSDAEISNFQKRNYRAGTQNWDILQDSSGRMYFANNEGVLIYNGINWSLYPLPNKTVVRSIAWGPDNNLYTGGQDELGYIEVTEHGIPKYTSLTAQIPSSYQDFADVWQIAVLDKSVFFLTNRAIFQYKDGKISIFTPVSSWLSMYKCHGELIAHDEQRGLLIYKDDNWQVLTGKQNLPPRFFITGIEHFGGDTSLVASSENGLSYLVGNRITPFGKEGSISRFSTLSALSKIDNQYYAAGTFQQGVIVFDKKGNIVKQFDQGNGLQNNNIRSIFSDERQNIWLGLENGIDFVQLGSLITLINPPAFNQGAGYYSSIFNGKIYYALSSGVFNSSISEDLSMVNNAVYDKILSGQTWNLTPLQGRLLIGRENDLYSYDGNNLDLMASGMGYWNFIPISDSQVLTGNYTGLQVFNTKGGQFKNAGYLSAVPGSSRFVFHDKGFIWVSHPYRGIFKIGLSDSAVQFYDKSKGLPSSQENYVFSIKGNVLAATEKGLYRFDEGSDRFTKDKAFGSYFKDLSLRYLKEDAAGNIWFVHNKSVGVLDLSTSKPQVIFISELNNRILSGFENIYPVNAETIIIGGEFGFFDLDFNKYRKQRRHPRIILQQVRLSGEKDSMIYGGYYQNMRNREVTTATAGKTISFANNTITILFSSPDAIYKPEIEFAYKLEGLEKDWSAWSSKTEANYISLPPGSYSFMVKARDGINNASPVSVYNFSIAPPWYKSIVAYLLYILSGLFLLYFFFKQQDKRHKKRHEKKLQIEREHHETAQREAASKHQIEIEKAEKELIRLRNENLEKEIKFKEEELASAAMNLVQKKEFILKVKEDLKHVINRPSDTNHAEDLKKIMRSMQSEDRLNKEWDKFSQHFNNVHAGFMDILVKKYPELKPHELKLCAYLRMNLSSKEIANLLSISVRGVEIGRYRLRKKLGLSTQTNLFQFLYDINKEE